LKFFFAMEMITDKRAVIVGNKRHRRKSRALLQFTVASPAEGASC
jgi:hypothetical protein